MVTENELQAILTDAIVEALAVEPQEVTPSSRLFADLGAESIDVLDLSFRLEKRLGIKVQLGETFPNESLKTDPDGRLTPESLAEMQKRFPGMSMDIARGPVTLDDLKELFTVESVLLYLREKLAHAAC